MIGGKEIQEYHKCDSLTLGEIVSELECDLDQRRRNPHYELRFPLLYQAVQRLCKTQEGRFLLPYVLFKETWKVQGPLSTRNEDREL